MSMAKVEALLRSWSRELDDRKFFSGDPSPWATKLLEQWVPELAAAVNGGERSVAELLGQKKDELTGQRAYVGDDDANTTAERRERIEALERAVAGR